MNIGRISDESDVQVIVTDTFDLLSFDTQCELIFTFVRATASEVKERVSALLHDLHLGAEIKCGVSDKLVCGRLSKMNFLNIAEWTPSDLDVEFRSEDVIIIVGREWDEKAGIVLRFGVAEIEVMLREQDVKPASTMLTSDMVS